ncbi:hypothetical protein DPMN_130447 [Dreissena polymorpha]|uniref:Uncharacterized protein n=1 Tax=Dreissena polymorpha TaxID=45954 RepID=A0A9D4H2Y4_DREPO|nr:hypothetical protein DPMN_130447 [Dreissena polymorpha]
MERDNMLSWSLHATPSVSKVVNKDKGMSLAIYQVTIKLGDSLLFEARSGTCY